MDLKRTRLLFVCLLISLVFFGCAAPGPSRQDKAAGREEMIRVLVLKGTEEIEIRGAEGAGHIRVRHLGGNAVTLNGEKASLPLRFSPSAEFIYIGKRPYRGVLEIYADEDGLVVIDEMPLEDYLVGIINNEISSKWPIDAIKAQAVVARTYAIYKKRKREGSLYDLTATHMDQVYTGAAVEDAASMLAVMETSGEVLFYDGAPALTVYHSNAGGMTESSKHVWSIDYPYLRAVKSRHDKGAPNFRWELSLSARAIGDMLAGAGYGIGIPRSIKIKEKTPTGRVKALVIRDGQGGELTLSGEELRKVLGYGMLKSTLFRVKKRGSTFTFRGRGSGHGVGLSQWGAKGMAEEGYSYRKILKHYYSGTFIRKIY